MTTQISDKHFLSFWKAVASGIPQKQMTAIGLFGIDATNSRGDTLLIIAVKIANLAIATFLLNHGANVNHRTSETQTTPLFEACKLKMPHPLLFATLLLEKGADPNLPGAAKFPPLIATAQVPELEPVLRLLIKKGADVNLREQAFGISPLFQAAYFNNPRAIRTLLAHQADPNIKTPKGETPLFIAIFKRHYEAAVALLKEGGADPNIEANLGSGPINVLYDLFKDFQLKRDLPYIRLLMEYGANPHQIAFGQGSTIAFVVQKGLIEVLKVFHSFNVDFNQPTDNKGNTTLMLAIENKRKNITSFLIKAGVDVNRISQEGNTALHFACSFKDEAAFEAIIDRVDDLNAQAKNRTTPLTLACCARASGIVIKLLERGALIDIPDDLGATPLHRAAVGPPAILKALVLSGSDVNYRFPDGATPLFFAAQEGCDENVDFLLKNGAEPKFMRNDGNSPLFVAHNFGHQKTVQLLLRSFVDDKNQIATFHLAADSTLKKAQLRVLEFEPILAPKRPEMPPADSEEKESESSTGFLRSQGFSSEQIKEFRKTLTEEIAPKTIQTEEIDPNPTLPLVVTEFH